MSRPSLRLTAAGQRISDKAIRRGIVLSLTSSSMGMFFCCLVGIPLQMFLEALGATSVQMGALGTILLLAGTAQIPGAFLSERLDRRKSTWLVAALIHRSLWFVPAALPFLFPDRPRLMVYLLLAITGLSMALAHSASAPWFSWMADLIPDRLKGKFWGRRQTWTMGALLLASWLSGTLLDAWPNPGKPGGVWTGFVVVFLLYATLGVADILLHCLVPEPTAAKRTTIDPWPTRILTPLRIPAFRNLTLAAGFWSFSLMFMASFSGLILKRDFDVTYTQLAWTVIFWTLGGMLSGKIWGSLITRLGGRSFTVIMLVATAFMTLSWFVASPTPMTLQGFLTPIPLVGRLAAWGLNLLPSSIAAPLATFTMPQAVWLFCLVNLLNGMFISGIMTGQFNLASRLAPKEGRTMAMAVHFSVVGLIGAIGPWLGGELLEWTSSLGGEITYPWGVAFHPIHCLVVIRILFIFSLVIPFLIASRPPEGDMPVRKAVSRLLVGNPIRTIHSIYTVGAAVPSWKRASAVRQLGADRTELAISDLIEKLYDPSSDVREEAAEALGNIGSPEAVDALIAKLEDPDADLAPQIAKALRRPRPAKAVDALVKKLNDEDTETQSQSAKTLGHIGDRRAVPALLNLLARSGDTRTVTSSSEALARLGELAAIHEILPRMKESRNPVLKRSLAVAVGDLLGEPEGFYQVLSREEEERGSEAENLLKVLRAQIRLATRKKLRDEGNTLIEAIDQRYGIGLGYLDFLRHGWEEADLGNRDHVDILLGIYFLSCRGMN
ncbi:MAG: MFS transporter [Planctomycetota bacterium]|jgi:MFS family permease